MDFSECYSDSVSSVSAAARCGCRKTLRTLIQRGHGVDSRDNRGWNALHEAAAAGSRECVRDILSAAGGGSWRRCRAFVNSLTHEGESACYLAARRGHLDVVRLLLTAHANINQLTNDSSCPLYAAVDGGHTAVVQLLVGEGADVNRTHTASCWTCLHQAVYKGHSEIVHVLVNVAELEALDDHRISPLFLAAQYGRRACLEILVNAGADVNSPAADMATPLLIAAQEGHRACVELLLDHQADPNQACSPEWPQLPIHAAAQFGHTQILRRLMAVTDRVCDRGAGAVSPLLVAVHNNQSSSVDVLLREGFSPDAQDECPLTLDLRSPLALALYRSADKPYSESVKLLVAAGATLNEEIWFYCLATEQPDLLELVLDQRWIPPQETLTREGSPPAARRGDGRTALKLPEVRAMLCTALNQLHFAACWLPRLLKAGLEPDLLLQPHMLQQADSNVLNFLLEFVNWSVLSRTLRHILSGRRTEKTWNPSPHFDSPPSLSHLCRLQVRGVLGADQLMRTDVVQRIPVPSLLHGFLQFRDVPETSYTHSPPSSPPSSRLQEHLDTRQHRHVL